jgi:hypothetical protein
MIFHTQYLAFPEDEPALETFYGSLRPVVCDWASCGSVLASITYLEKHLKKRHRKDLKDSVSIEISRYI